MHIDFRTVRRSALSALGALCMASALLAQDAASTQLETQLGTILKPTQVEMVGHNVTSAGTVVKLTQGNFLYQTPVSQPILCAGTVKDGKTSIASGMCRLAGRSSGGFLPEGSRLYITKIRVNVPKDTVTLELTDAAIDQTTGGLGHPSLKTAVNFVFPKDFLGKADAGQVADVIANTLPVDNAPPAGAAPAQAQAPPPPQAAPVPMQVELGMTEDQVRSILGQPTSQRAGGAQSKVYIYNKQITFQNGVVSAIQ